MMFGLREKVQEESRPIGIGVIDEQVGKLKDIGGKKLGIFSNSLFDESIKEYAKNENIDLYCLVDTNEENVRPKISTLVLHNFTWVSKYKVSFQLFEKDREIFFVHGSFARYYCQN